MWRLARFALVASLLGSALRAQTGAALVGTVVDGHDGQPLSNVIIRLVAISVRTQSNAQGTFSIHHVPPGEYLLQASTVGYRVVTSPIFIYPDQTTNLRLVLSPDAYRRVDTVAVQSSAPFPPIGDDAIDRFSLAGNDIKNLGTVLADDPLRAVQAAPGVTSNDDFEARFSVRGADPNRVGIYLDGIQLHQVVHTLEGVSTSGSNSVFNSDLVSELNLYSGAEPARFGDSSAGALDVVMRDGNADEYSFRAVANFAYAGFLAEGPAGMHTQCSWISGFRKSYLQYILQDTLSDPSMSFGFQDLQGRIACRVNQRNTVTFSLISGSTGVDLTSQKSTLGVNSLMLARQTLALANLGWQYVPHSDLLFTSHLAWTQDSFHDANPSQSPLGSGNYGEWQANANVTWFWTADAPLNAGASVRSIRDAGYLNQYNAPGLIQVLDRYNGAGTLAGGYLEQGWTAAHNRLHFNAGVRWDHHSLDSITTVSPQAGFSFSPWSSAQFRLGWGQYTQFPEISQFASNLGSHALLPIRSAQASAAFEQRLGQRTRVQATFYNRQDRHLLDQPFLDPRLLNGAVFVPPAQPLYENSLRGYGRGAEVLLQRTIANGLTGWLSYAYGRTRLHESATGDSFPSDYDQRHTVNAYASYRIRPTVNLSARFSYGSGYPLPAFLQSKEPYSYTWASVYDLGPQRNRLRLPPYGRIDVRVNKTWIHTKWKTTLYAEVVNITNKANYRYDNFEAYTASGLAFITLDRMFPILPSVGVVFER